MVRRFFLSVLMLTAVSYFAGLPLAQAARQQRILQPIIVNGQQAEGVTIVQNGVVQNTGCPDP